MILTQFQTQMKRVDKVYLIDDASLLKYKLRHDFVELIMLKEK